MSSGTRYQPTAMRDMQGALAKETMRKVSNLGMSPRQRLLNTLWAHYCTTHYDARQMAWDGTPNIGMVEKELISTAGSIPPGFYDAAGQMQDLPLRFRKPTAPYPLVRAIVNRFTGLLFSQKRHPEFRVLDDGRTQDFLHGMIEAARLWPAMIMARAYGGATGSVGIGFKFCHGKPEIEVHDPRWSTPTFKDRSATHLEVASLDKKYMYPVDVFDHETGEWVQVPFWYRRYIDDKIDVVWPRVPVGDGVEPNWETYMQTDLVVQHDLGFAPVQWVQNTPVQDAVDGEPDCHGAYDMIEQIDVLNSQADRGIISNCFGAETEFISLGKSWRFSDFDDGDKVTILTHTGAWQEATVRSHGDQQLYEIKLSQWHVRAARFLKVTVRATRDHRWLLDDDSETVELKVGDMLVPPPKPYLWYAPAWTQWEESGTMSHFKVESIEKSSIEKVWCLEVEGDRSFVLPSGIVTGNCDPTLLLVTKDELSEIRKGSDNAIKLTEGSGSYLEISASGITAAREKAREYRADVLETVQVVLDHPDVAGRTATEIERTYGSMIDKADVLREQYGERGIKPLAEKMLEAVRKLKGGRIVTDEHGISTRVRMQVDVPQRVVNGELQSRELGDGSLIELSWGPYFTSSLADATQAASAASMAKASNLIDEQAATRFVAPHFGIDDPDAAIKEIRDRAAREEAFLTSSLLGGGVSEDSALPETPEVADTKGDAAAGAESADRAAGLPGKKA